jgi:dephospho-CoA kinase
MESSRNVFKIGVTGGIGSGKSTVCRFFSLMGLPVYNSDSRAKQLMTSDIKITSELKKLLGDDIYLADGSINKAKMTSLVFFNENLRKAINAIVHPAVWRDFDNWCEVQGSISSIVVHESALLFESGRHLYYDSLITTICGMPERIDRIMQRDQCSQSSAQSKISSQLPDGVKVLMSDFTIDTSRNKMIIEELIKIYNEIIKKARK